MSINTLMIIFAVVYIGSLVGLIFTAIEQNTELDKHDEEIRALKGEIADLKLIINENNKLVSEHLDEHVKIIEGCAHKIGEIDDINESKFNDMAKDILENSKALESVSKSYELLKNDILKIKAQVPVISYMSNFWERNNAVIDLDPSAVHFDKIEVQNSRIPEPETVVPMSKRIK